eukprot:jgi/Mesvir1/11619/Mv00025-RA.1
MVRRVLNVAEKPSVAKELAIILSRGQFSTRDGFSQYNRIFTFQYAIRGVPCEMVVTSVTGHLMEIDFIERYRKWSSCPPVALYDAPILKKVAGDKEDLARTLRREAAGCSWLVLWLDCDREGENIACEVRDVCLQANARLDVYRARFSALVERDIHHACQNLDRVNERFSDAVDARQEIDLRIGSSFTRFLTLLLQNRFALPPESNIISYGPCQFPTLGFVVERYWEVKAHVAESFWSIQCSYTDTQQRVSADFTWHRDRLFDHLVATAIYELCMEDPTATVVDVSGREVRRYPPVPLNTVELQKRASRHLRMTGEHVMKVAEELYQAGFLSYPRTETDKFPDSMDLRAIVGEHMNDPHWGDYAQMLLDPNANLWRNPGDGGHDDQAHPPIYPTKHTTGEPAWGPDKKRLYDFVVRHFLACCSQPAVGYETTASIDIAREGFTARGLMITARNFLDVYPWEKWGDRNLPVFQIGQQFIPTKLMLVEGRTQPPSYLAEADLIGLMDKHGIGTDATMHDHVKTIQTRNYAVMNPQHQFLPTPLGEALVMAYDNMGNDLWKPSLRAQMERDMKGVSDGAKAKQALLDECLGHMKQIFVEMNTRKDMVMEAMGEFFERSDGAGDGAGDGGARAGYTPIGIVMDCVTCGGGHMVLKRHNETNKLVIGCSNFPTCSKTIWLPSATLDAQVLTATCPRNCAPGPPFLVQFRFSRSGIPPQYSTDMTGCVACDADLKEFFQTMSGGGGGGAARRAPGGAPRGGAAPRGGGGRGGGAGMGHAAPRGPGPGGGGPGPGPGPGAGGIARGAAAPAGRAGVGGGGGHAGQAGGQAAAAGRPGHARAAAGGAGSGGHEREVGARGRSRAKRGGAAAAAGGEAGGRSDGHERGQTRGRGRGRGAAAGGRGHAAIPECGCGVACVELQSRTPNNPGRAFFKCADRDAPCGFFVWKDEYINNGPASRGGGATGGRGGRAQAPAAAFASAAGGYVGTGAGGMGGGGPSRACFRCGEEGHYASNCPN